VISAAALFEHPTAEPDPVIESCDDAIDRWTVDD